MHMRLVMNGCVSVSSRVTEQLFKCVYIVCPHHHLAFDDPLYTFETRAVWVHTNINKATVSMGAALKYLDDLY